MLLGEQPVSKAGGRGSTPRARAWPTWLDLERRLSCKQAHAGANPVVGSWNELNPDGVEDLHWTLRRSGSWFESRSGYFAARKCFGAHSGFLSRGTRFNSWTGCLKTNALRVCRICTAAFEAARRRSTRRQGTDRQCVLGVCRICIRPCEGRGPGSIPGKDILTLEPDGTATACKAVQSGFDSRQRLVLGYCGNLVLSRISSATPLTARTTSYLSHA